WERALACEAGVRAGVDPEDLHKLRVALRRFRAAARVFGQAVDRAAARPVADQLAADAAAVAGPLGSVRDRDVFIAYFQRCAETAPRREGIAIAGLLERGRAER